MIELADQICGLERIAEEIGPTPELRAAIKTLQWMAQHEDFIRQAMAQRKAMKDPVARKLLEAFPDATVQIKEVST